MPILNHSLLHPYLLFFLLLPHFLFSLSPYPSAIGSQIAYSSDLPSFKGLILINHSSQLHLMGYQDVHGVLTYQVDLPGKVADLKKSLSPLFGRPLNQETIQAIKSCVVAFYQDHDHPFMAAIIPNQKLSYGTLHMVIQEGTLGTISVTGNRWFSSKHIMKAVRLKSGQMIALNRLNQDLYWLNRNPFRQIDALFSPGEEVGTTDIELRVHERFPLRVYGGIDNTGNDATGTERLVAGFNWGSVFRSDHSLSYQFSSSTNPKRFHSHSLFYEAPLPWRHSLIVYGGYSTLDTHIRMPDLNQHMCHTTGFSLQGSLRYNIPFRTHTSFLHELIWGFDFKRTNNTLEVLGVALKDTPQNVNLTQVMLGYNLGYKPLPFKLSFTLEGFYSPGEWIADQSNETYSSLRFGAKNHYFYARSAFTLAWYYYKKWSMHAILRGQVASSTLLPSEEYGVGGYNTVRGYKERLLNGDNAVIANFEMHSPPLQLFEKILGKNKVKDKLVFLAFVDYGFTHVYKTVKTQPSSDHIISVGPGIRYNIGPYLTARADLGFQLHHIGTSPVTQKDDSSYRVNFSVIAGY